MFFCNIFLHCLQLDDVSGNEHERARVGAEAPRERPPLGRLLQLQQVQGEVSSDCSCSF